MANLIINPLSTGQISRQALTTYQLIGFLWIHIRICEYPWIPAIVKEEKILVKVAFLWDSQIVSITYTKTTALNEHKNQPTSQFNASIDSSNFVFSDTSNIPEIAILQDDFLNELRFGYEKQLISTYYIGTCEYKHYIITDLSTNKEYLFIGGIQVPEYIEPNKPTTNAKLPLDFVTPKIHHMRMVHIFGHSEIMNDFGDGFHGQIPNRHAQDPKKTDVIAWIGEYAEQGDKVQDFGFIK